MKNRNDGFILLECIISLFIISILASTISSVLYNAYYSTNNKNDKLEVLNIAKSRLNKIKYDIRYKQLSEIVLSKVEVLDGYTIKQNIEEDSYYQCYKITLEVINNKESINLTSYIVRE